MCKKEQILNDEDLKLWNLVADTVQPLNSTTRISLPTFQNSRKDSTSNRLDLHGLPIQIAFKITMDFVYDHFFYNTKDLLIITGRSGDIYREFPEWMNQLDRYVKRFQKAPDNLGGAGAWIVRLNQKSTNIV